MKKCILCGSEIVDGICSNEDCKLHKLKTKNKELQETVNAEKQEKENKLKEEFKTNSLNYFKQKVKRFKKLQKLNSSYETPKVQSAKDSRAKLFALEAD